MSTSPETLYVVEFSPVQRCWHIESLREHVKKNLELLLLRKLDVTAYCAVALAENRQAAHDCSERISEFMQKHDQQLEEGRA